MSEHDPPIHSPDLEEVLDIAADLQGQAREDAESVLPAEVIASISDKLDIPDQILAEAHGILLKRRKRRWVVAALVLVGLLGVGAATWWGPRLFPGPDPDWLHAEVARLRKDSSQLVADRQYLEALKLARQAVRLVPKEPSSLLHLAGVMRAAQLPEREIQKVYRQILEAAPESDEGVEAMVALAKTLGTGSAAEAEEAIALYRRAIRVQPFESQQRLALGELLERLNRLDDLIALYEDASRRDPRNTSYRAKLAEVYEKLGRADKAEQAYRSVLQIQPEYGYMYHRLYLLLERDGRRDEGIRFVEDAHRRYPGSDSILGALGELYEKRGRMSDAERAFRQALTIHAGQVYPHQRLGQFYERRGRFQEAIAALEQATKIDSRAGYPYALMGDIYDRQGDRSKAVNMLKTAKRLNPNDQSVALKLAEIHERWGKLAEAETYYKAYARLNLNDYGHQRLAQFYFAAGRKAESIRAWQAAIALAQDVERQAYLQGELKKVKALP